ncbi:MAG: hypothetical protein J3K34DRAFT_443004 [Monoraphidium minutum]|nr:MAG: hypothetical protein J3K34DRAFT_443004 [Monoraphidium minutum]
MHACMVRAARPTGLPCASTQALARALRQAPGAPGCRSPQRAAAHAPAPTHDTIPSTPRPRRRPDAGGRGLRACFWASNPRARRAPAGPADHRSIGAGACAMAPAALPGFTTQRARPQRNTHRHCWHAPLYTFHSSVSFSGRGLSFLPAPGQPGVYLTMACDRLLCARIGTQRPPGLQRRARQRRRLS